MSARPLAQRAGRAEQRPDGLAVHLPDLARTELLAPLAAAVWQAADGQTNLEGLLAAARTVEPGADLNRLWLVLDVLADADLLAQRLAPPGPDLDRRGWLRTVASVAAAAAVAAVTLQAPGAHAKERKADPERERAQEANTKAQQKKGDGKADERKQKGTVRAERAERRGDREHQAKSAERERAEAGKARETEEQSKTTTRPVRAEAQPASSPASSPDAAATSAAETAP
jgi:hypothetical protein